MRVVCYTTEDFLKNLEAEVSNVYRNIVYLNTTKREIQEGKWECGLQASAVMETEDGGQYILDYGESVGFDYPTESDEVGSREVETRCKLIESFCQRNELDLRPGVVQQ